MDETGLTISVAILALAVVLIAISTGWWLWQRKRAERTKSWARAEATIESGDLEVVTSDEYTAVRLPVFAFSYRVDGEYHSGRFALRPFTTDPDGSLISRMIGQKIQVRYNPLHVEVWFIPDETIGGCRVEQKLGPHFVDYSPRD
jgi:hypothetical protein